ncbi:MAG: hypothetical protein ABIY51_07550 [Ferruginibacter sp.]
MVVIVIGSWEHYLRHKGYNIAYDDGDGLWANKRAMVYEPIDKATVFIGSSRNKYDIDIYTWQSITGDHPIQLALEGDSPLPVLDDLSADIKFKGKVIVDVTERLFFTTRSNNVDEPKEMVAYYKERTPTQRFSFKVNHLLESQFVFLDKNNFSLYAILEKLNVPKRKGAFAEPYEYPIEAGRITFDRQNIMMDEFLSDTTLRNHVKAIWNFYEKRNTELPAKDTRLDSFLIAIKKSCDKIKSRGGDVLFVHTPSAGFMLDGENKNFPREDYWDRLLTFTNCKGIHFADYSPLNHFEIPEFSHLGRPDAIIWTRNLIQILQQEKGWTFPHKKNYCCK